MCTSSYQTRRLFLTCPRRPGRYHLCAVTQWRTFKYLGHQRNALLTHVSLITPPNRRKPLLLSTIDIILIPHRTVYWLYCFHACIPGNARASCQLINWCCCWEFKPSAAWSCAVDWMVSGFVKPRLVFVFKGNLCKKTITPEDERGRIFRKISRLAATLRHKHILYIQPSSLQPPLFPKRDEVIIFRLPRSLSLSPPPPCVWVRLYIPQFQFFNQFTDFYVIWGDLSTVIFKFLQSVITNMVDARNFEGIYPSDGELMLIIAFQKYFFCE